MVAINQAKEKLVATGVLEEFRRRFVATAVKKNRVPSFVESAEPEACRDPKVTKGLQPTGSPAPVDQCSSDCAC